jgi:cold shock CspA family protein
VNSPDHQSFLEPQNLAKNISKDIQFFNTRYINQFNIQIPSGTLKPVDYYRTTFFPFLTSSEYKDNICYLLQCTEYQIWQYRLFKPNLSLENSIFFQLLITFGIITEAIVIAILLNPLLKSKANYELEEAKNITQIINNQSFQKNVQLLCHLKQLSPESSSLISEIRKQLRNLVHLQHWPGKLFETLTIEVFNQRVSAFFELLRKLKEETPGSHIDQELYEYFAISDEASRKGKIQRLNPDRAFGFIRDDENKTDYFFLYKNITEKKKSPAIGQPVMFKTKNSSKGLEATSIKVLC